MLKSRYKKKKESDLMSSVMDRFKDCDDFLCQKIISENTGVEIYKMYINQMVDKDIIDNAILKPLSFELNNIENSTTLLEYLKSGKIYHLDILCENDINKIVTSILEGNFILICENQGYIFDTKKYNIRSVEKPESEVSSKGAKESFIESSAINVSLLRRRIQTEKLKVVDKSIGTETKTRVSIMYIEGIAKKEIVDKVKEKIDSLNIPSIVSSSDFEEHIISRKYSIFPELIATERTDKVAANLIEGKVAVVVDGISTVYIMPAVFAMFMQAPEEYSVNYFVSSFIRLMRYFCLFVATIFPALYIAITTFHQEMLPTTLAESIIASKQDVPLPAFLEIIIMLLAFEILLEAGARMPKTAGQTVSIVGALIVGDAAVNAKFVSPAVVVIVAITAICGFVIPNQDLSNAVRIGRMGLVLVASVAGLYGLSLATIITVYYMCTLESFSIPYLKPFTSNDGKNLTADTIIRGHLNKKKGKMVRW